MAVKYSNAKAVMLVGGSVRLEGASITGWLLGGSVRISGEASAAMLLGGTVALTAAPRPIESSSTQYILCGTADVFDAGFTESLLTIAMGGRAVEWGFLQEGSELETEDLEVIPGENGRAAAVVFRLQRTEVTCTVIFLKGTPLPKRGDLLSWLTADGLAISARILQRRVLYSLNGAAVMSVTATKWDGL